MTKVVKLALINNVTDKNRNKVEYYDLNKCLWDLQKETRDLKNTVIRECWEWYEFSNDYYKLKRMVDVLNEDLSAPPDRILKNVREAVDGFVMEAEQFDDLTMLCVEYLGTNG